MLIPSLFSTAVAVLSLNGLVQAAPQGPGGQQNGGPAGQTTTAAVVATAASTTAAASAAVATVAASSISQAAEPTSTTACNNSPYLCNRYYNNITHMGAHDSAFLRDASTSYSVSGNQFYNATVALSAGLRLLQAQVHNYDGVLQLCHSSCTLLNAGTLESWLSDIAYWMGNNPNDVVTILLVNSDSNSTASFGSAFSSSGLSKYGYTPSSTTGPISTWPTLQTLINDGTRVVSFVTNIDYSSTYPYLLPEFNYMFETAYGQTSASDFVCTLDRPSSISSAAKAISSGYMPLINHFLDTSGVISIPDVSDITTTNSNATSTTGTLNTQGQLCKSEWGIKPTFMLVDFWNVGPAISTADILNGITDATGRTTVGTGELSSSSSTSDTRANQPSSVGTALALIVGITASLFLI